MERGREYKRSLGKVEEGNKRVAKEIVDENRDSMSEDKQSWRWEKRKRDNTNVKYHSFY